VPLLLKTVVRMILINGNKSVSKEQCLEIYYIRFILLIIFPHDSDYPKSAILSL